MRFVFFFPFFAQFPLSGVPGVYLFLEFAALIYKHQTALWGLVPDRINSRPRRILRLL